MIALLALLALLFMAAAWWQVTHLPADVPATLEPMQIAR
jgi:hypothetical protein